MAIMISVDQILAISLCEDWKDRDRIRRHFSDREEIPLAEVLNMSSVSFSNRLWVLSELLDNHPKALVLSRDLQKHLLTFTGAPPDAEQLDGWCLYADAERDLDNESFYNPETGERRDINNVFEGICEGYLLPVRYKLKEWEAAQCPTKS